ncbi:17538_t:CDS:10 [Acaulospora colombiana]|uniref:17538_t:CDS:1 n=1 Tax=Acaulospora colombiana TaxID=27376 RepID=A0ACA9KZR3_9GLOM|nr:17538_t:CDS:10 [Acaulospora colombiana]
MLDINLSLLHPPESVEKPEEAEEIPYQRHSLEALFGRKRLGWVTLPEWLDKAILDIVKGHEKETVRVDTGRIYQSLGSTTGFKERDVPSGKIAVNFMNPIFGPCKTAAKTFKRNLRENPDNRPHILEYGDREAVAYLAGYLPVTYGPIYNVLHELSMRLPDFEPTNVMDFGTGPGTAMWATSEVWGKRVKSYLGIDTSESMLRMAEKLFSSAPYADSLQAHFRRYITYDPRQVRYNLVISAFALGDLPNDNIRESILESLWSRTEDILVLVEKGNPAGFKTITDARKKILRNAERWQAEVMSSPSASTSNEREDGVHVASDSTSSKEGVHVVAPMQAKRVHGVNHEDSKYSYVVLRRGTRPKPATSGSSEKLFDEKSVDANSAKEFIADAFHWSRLIVPPKKRTGHVVMDYCSKTGYIERMIIPKSQGKIEYRDARKAMWGDLFPHQPKKPAERRITGVGDPDEGEKGRIDFSEDDDGDNRKGTHRHRNLMKKKKKILRLTVDNENLCVREL